MGTNQITCNCGGPAMGTAHSPDCDVELYLHNECESCGSDEHVHNGLCIDCAEAAEEWEENARDY